MTFIDAISSYIELYINIRSSLQASFVRQPIVSEAADTLPSATAQTFMYFSLVMAKCEAVERKLRMQSHIMNRESRLHEVKRIEIRRG